MTAQRRDYDQDLQMFTSEAEVNETSLVFLRWAVANGRLKGDGYSHHSSTASSVEPCNGDKKCGICKACRQA
jgi:hypothetical protein